MKLSIIIPTFNEEPTISTLLHRILATPLPIEYELITVDDHSSDQTYVVEQQVRDTTPAVRIRTLRNRTNKGKGACIRQGLKHATGELVIVQDGDLEYEPADIALLLAPIVQGRASVVFGSRFLARGWPEGMAWPNYVANRLLTWLTNRLCRLRLTDVYSGYKILPRDLLLSLKVRADRFEFESEVAAKLAKRHVQLLEVPIAYHGRTKAQGKKIRLKDFWIAVRTLLRYR